MDSGRLMIQHLGDWKTENLSKHEMINKIVIPSLQRDYAQGNQHDKIEPLFEYLLMDSTGA
ncbi:MAG: hypothetical protein ACLTOV_10870 [Phocaeicola sp.]